MVEEWDIGDKFEVINSSSFEHLSKGDVGIVIEKPSHSGYVYFKKGYSIHVSRIKKISKNTVYELW